MKFSTIFALSCAALASGRSVPARRASFTQQNGEDAISLNTKFASLTPDSSCTAGENACVQNAFAQCVNGKFALQPCSSGLICAALPLVNSPGTSIACTTAQDRDARIAATGATGANPGNVTSSSAAPAASSTASANNGGGSSTGNSTATGGNSTAPGADAQSSLTLSPQVIAKGFANNGQDQPEAGQVPSLTSTNNFINYCLTVPHLPITNGQQIKTGSCNPAPMGVIAATTNMPSAKFQFPTNGAVLPANTSFTVQLAVAHIETGSFVNANANYFSAPQQVNAQGDVIGHSHIVIEKLTSMNQTTPTNPGQFAFFKGVNDKAVNGVLSADVTGGLDEGVYRIASINSAANHQPILVAIAQHGSLDDMVYFIVKKNAANSSTSASASSTIPAVPAQSN